ncbi:hypothetical protein SmJEL517_g01436 [Synchytrium microbalum]|uniref:SEC7 domain-containing protein n=1 Tax=Synchytrium microbalum TaxID=1806994 RepID=A0A507CF78_9FUNG|nr:uncharacterized protein SmJEL517_g01436 [Synchytrium microbalum]TPX36173.1 hypothetical protein SmJEL517_g01436 [Synchytrium microbalum]
MSDPTEVLSETSETSDTNKRISTIFSKQNRKLRTSASSLSLKPDVVPSTENVSQSPISALFSRIKNRETGQSPRGSHSKGLSMVTGHSGHSNTHSRQPSNDPEGSTQPLNDKLVPGSPQKRLSGKQTHKRQSSLPIRHVGSLDDLIAHVHAATHLDLSNPVSPVQSPVISAAKPSIKSSNSSMSHRVEDAWESKQADIVLARDIGDNMTGPLPIPNHDSSRKVNFTISDSLSSSLESSRDGQLDQPLELLHRQPSLISMIPSHLQQPEPIIEESLPHPSPQYDPDSVLGYLMDTVNSNMKRPSVSSIAESPMAVTMLKSISHQPSIAEARNEDNDSFRLPPIPQNEALSLFHQSAANTEAKPEIVNSPVLESEPEPIPTPAPVVPLVAPTNGYKSMNPTEVARLLYENNLPDVPSEDTALILGKGDYFHVAILTAYMNMFDLKNLKLEEAFRRFCAALIMKGETQQQDRILMRLAQRYWDCNPQTWSLFYSADVVHIILFSILMLNTDLRNASIGITSSRMSKSEYLKNTLNTIEGMVNPVRSEDSDRTGTGTVSDDRTSTEKETFVDRDWRRKMEAELRELYKSISRHNIVSRSASPDLTSSPSSSSLPIRTSNGTLKREGSSLSVSTTHSTSTTATNFGDNMSVYSGRGIRFVASLRRNHNGSSQTLERNTTLDRKSLASAFSGSSLGRNTSETDPYGSSASIRSTSVEIGGANLMSDPGRAGVMQGLIIRKRLRDPEGGRARMRRWVKAWGVLRMDMDGPLGVALTLQRVENDSDKFSPTEIGGNLVDPSALPTTMFAGTGGNGSTSPFESIGRRSLASREARSRPAMETSRPPRLLRVAPNSLETIPLLHALSISHPEPGYSSSRPHVFSLHLNDGSTMLFQVPSLQSLNMWVRAINYWAARRSREPLRGGIGNMEYGWGKILSDRKARLAEERERKTHGRRGESFSMSMTAKEAAAAVSLVIGDEYEFGTRASPHVHSGSISGSSGKEAGGGSSGMPPMAVDPSDESVKAKIFEWFPPPNPIHTRTGGDYSEVEQMNAMKKQVDIVATELEEHAGLREAMEIKYGSHPSQKDKAQKNWIKRQQYLAYEHQKYATYVEALVQGLDYITGNHQPFSPTATHYTSTIPRTVELPPRMPLTSDVFIPPNNIAPSRPSNDATTTDSSSLSTLDVIQRKHSQQQQSDSVSRSLDAARILSPKLEEEGSRPPSPLPPQSSSVVDSTM